MNQTLLDNLIIGGVALLSYAGEQYHILPAGTANIIIALVGGAVVGQARAIANANTTQTEVSTPQSTNTPVTQITTSEKG